MRVIVTGGAGFIGSVIARRLVAAGGEVFIVDNLSTGLKSNVAQGAELIVADVADPASLKQLPGGAFDAVIHMAAQSSGAIGQKNPYADMQTNVGATVLLSRWCLDRGVSRFLFPSSMNVYGHGTAEFVDEGAPTRPIGYYGASKLASENYLRLAADEGLKVTCFRIYNAYGAGQNLGNRYQGMISIYLAYLLDRVPVPVTGDLDRYRDFVHVDDIAAAFELALHRNGTPSHVYNIGVGRKVTVREVLRLLVEQMDFPADYPVEEQAGSAGDVFGSVANFSRAQNELGWTPRVALEPGLADMVAWAKQQPWPQQ